MPGDMGFLNGLLQQSSQAPTADDPIMHGAFAAGRVADQRNIDRQRAALAEQLGAYGMGDSGAFNTKLGGIQQRVGEQQALRERSEEHTSELQSRRDLVCRLLLEKKKKKNKVCTSTASVDAVMDILRYLT